MNVAFTFFVVYWIECAESGDVTESPREWKYEPDLSAGGVKIVGDSSPELELPQRLCPPRPKSGVDWNVSSSSVKSTSASCGRYDYG